MNSNDKRLGSWAIILTGPHRGRKARVLGFFQEEENGSPVQDGAKGHILYVDGAKVAFWSHEVQMVR